MTVLGLKINFISYVATKIKEISHYSKLCRNPFKILFFHFSAPVPDDYDKDVHWKKIGLLY